MANIADQPSTFAQASNGNAVVGAVEITFNGTDPEAYTSITCDGTPGCSVARTGTGLYTLTHPTATQVVIAYSTAKLADTDGTAFSDVIGTGKTPSGGTATFRCATGTNLSIDPQDGDKISVSFYFLPSGSGV